LPELLHDLAITEKMTAPWQAAEKLNFALDFGWRSASALR